MILTSNYAGYKNVILEKLQIKKVWELKHRGEAELCNHFRCNLIIKEQTWVEKKVKKVKN